MTSSVLNPRDVIAFIAGNSGTITNHDLVRHFRRQLKDPAAGEENRLLLKGVTKEVGTVTGSGEGGRKTIALKPKFAGLSTSEIYSEYLFLVATRDIFEERGGKLPQPPSRLVHSAAPPPARPEPADVVVVKPPAGPRLPPKGRVGPGAAISPPPLPERRKISAMQEQGARGGKPVRRKIRVSAPEFQEKADWKTKDQHQLTEESPEVEKDQFRKGEVTASQPDLNRSMYERGSYRRKAFKEKGHSTKRSTRKRMEPAVSPEDSVVLEAAKTETKDEANSSTYDKKRQAFKERRTFQRSESVPVSPGTDKGTSSAVKEADNMDLEKKRKAFKENRRGQKSVKDLTKDFDDIATRSQLKLTDHMKKSPQQTGGYRVKKRSVPANAGDGEDRRVEFTFAPLTKEERAWMLAASKNDSHALNEMLSRSLVVVRDPLSGYAALHWVAKHGNAGMVRRLVASGGKINQRSRGGYTPLMLAAMLDREEAYAALLEIPGCNPDLRDYSGKKARDYLPRRDDLEENSEGYWESESGYDGEEDDADGGGKRKRMMQKVDRGSSFLRGFVRGSSRNLQEKFERDQY